MTALFLPSGEEGAGGEKLTRRAFIREGVRPGNVPQPATGSPLATDAMQTAGYDEAWLQRLLFANPELILLDGVDGLRTEVVPLCRELPLPNPGGNVFLDILGVTRRGRLVLLECKLWRNPQARREVVAQILEYAALLRRWSFSDLTARIKRASRSSGSNPIFEIASGFWPNLDESAFVDAVSSSLGLGDFHLVIAGDGIRSDLHAVADHLNSGLSRLSFLELQLWADPAGGTLVVPIVPLRTEIIVQRIVVDRQGVPVELEEVGEGVTGGDEAEDRTPGKPRNPETVARDRAFWQRFIDAAKFDHPEQAAPRHGGHNWVRIVLPAPARPLVAYRNEDEIGLYNLMKGDVGEVVFERLSGNLDTLRADSGLDLSATIKSQEPFDASLWVKRKRSSLASEDAQLDWLIDAANRFVTMIRPQLTDVA